MTLEIWIPTAVMALVIWACRNLILTRLTNAVRHEFESKLAVQNAAFRKSEEELKAELRQQEEEFKADLRQKESAISTLRSAPLSGMAARMAVTDTRRIEAVDQLWEAVHDLGPMKAAAAYMAVMKFEALAKEAQTNSKVQQLFAGLNIPEEDGRAASEKAHKARPHLSPLSWAYFSAYQAIISYGAVQIKLLQQGIADPQLLNTDHVVKLIGTALPHQAEYIEKFGVGAAYHLLDELEGSLLGDLRESLAGNALDMEALVRAGNIQTAAAELSAAIETAGLPPAPSEQAV